MEIEYKTQTHKNHQKNFAWCFFRNAMSESAETSKEGLLTDEGEG